MLECVYMDYSNEVLLHMVRVSLFQNRAIFLKKTISKVGVKNGKISLSKM
jgi:hypothetical protein